MRAPLVIAFAVMRNATRTRTELDLMCTPALVAFAVTTCSTWTTRTRTEPDAMGASTLVASPRYDGDDGAEAR